MPDEFPKVFFCLLDGVRRVAGNSGFVNVIHLALLNVINKSE